MNTKTVFLNVILYKFSYGEYFDRILWSPLKNYCKPRPQCDIFEHGCNVLCKDEQVSRIIYNTYVIITR